MIRSHLLTALCLSLALATPGLAQETPEAADELVLQAKGGEPATFDLEALKAMPVTEFETSTVWTDGVIRFTGVALADLLEDADAEGTVIRAMARDGYAVEIPVTDAVPGGPIVAYQMDGEPLDVEMMGPYWIIYPYDSDEAYKAKEFEDRSIWQLKSLTLTD